MLLCAHVVVPWVEVLERDRCVICISDGVRELELEVAPSGAQRAHDPSKRRLELAQSVARFEHTPRICEVSSNNIRHKKVK